MAFIIFIFLPTPAAHIAESARQPTGMRHPRKRKSRLNRGVEARSTALTDNPAMPNKTIHRRKREPRQRVSCHVGASLGVGQGKNPLSN